MTRNEPLPTALLRALWLVCVVLLWLFWLASVPLFLQRAAAGTLPTVVINGTSAAQLAAEDAAAWGISIGRWAVINTLVSGVTFFVFSLVALLIWWRVHTGYGLLTAYVLLGAGSAFMSVAIYSAELSRTALTIWELGAVIWPFFFPWLYLFPNGRAVPRALLWVFVPLAGSFAALFLLNIPNLILQVEWRYADTIAGLQPIFDFLVIPLFVVVCAAQIYRYRRVSGPVEKAQTKWFVLGLLVAFLPTTVLSLFVNYPAELDTLTFMAIPLGLGVSILRYHLWDFDVVIRKTVVYAILTAVLALAYFGSVLLLQNVFGTVAGEQSPAIIVLSTLLIAALFAPVRGWVQETLDRRFFRKKYDAQQVLEAFARTTRDETELRALSAELARAVQETMQPDRVVIWLNREESS